MKALTSIGNILKAIEDNGRIVTIVAMTLVVFIQVAARILFKWSSPAMEEAARFIMIWSIFIGAVVTTREDSHICMGGFSRTRKGRAVFSVISKVVTLVFLAVYVKWSYDYAVHSCVKNMRSIVLNVPLIVVHSCFLITGVLMLFHTGVNLVKQVRLSWQVFKGGDI